MGATLIVDDPELAQALSGAHLPTSEVWKTELASLREDIVGSIGITTGNRTRVARMVAQWLV